LVAMRYHIQRFRLIEHGKLSGEDLGKVGNPITALSGAVIAGAMSAIVIGLYGVGPGFLYLGPTAGIVGTIGVIICFVYELKDLKSEIQSGKSK